VPCAARARLTASISDLAGLDRWRAAAASTPGGLDFHVEIDTGIGRGGFDWSATAAWAPAVHARLAPGLRWSGAFTQFHSADAPDRASAVEQWQRFNESLAALPVERGALLVHVANSAAALRFPGFRADAVRPGIYLYGGDPAPGLEAGEIAPVRRVVSVRARLVLVRDVSPGASVGYGATHVAQSGARWGTLAIGYADGLPRALSNRGHAIVRGRRVPIVGRISMDLTVVDLSRAPEAEVGDIATLVGRDGDEEITPEAVAALAETINYEILTGLAPRLPRVEVDCEVDR
jgi:alanine racemase